MYSPAGAPGCQCERRARQREGRSSRPAARSMLELDDPPGRGQLRVGEQVPDLDDRPARHAMGVQQHQQSSARATLARSTSPTSASCWIRRGLAAKRTWVATARVNQPSGAGKGRRTERTPATTARARRIREPPRLPNTTGGQTYRLLSMAHAEHPPYPLYALNAMRVAARRAARRPSASSRRDVALPPRARLPAEAPRLAADGPLPACPWTRGRGTRSSDRTSRVGRRIATFLATRPASARAKRM